MRLKVMEPFSGVVSDLKKGISSIQINNVHLFHPLVCKNRYRGNHFDYFLYLIPAILPPSTLPAPIFCIALCSLATSHEVLQSLARSRDRT